MRFSLWRRSDGSAQTGLARRARIRRRRAPLVHNLEGRALLSSSSHHVNTHIVHIAKQSFYQQTNLVTDNQSVTPAQHTDPNLVNPWGMSFKPATTTTAGGPFWVSDADSGVSTIYDAAGNPLPLVVSIPPEPGSPSGTKGSPTGQVFNGTSDFAILGGPAIFIFASEDGVITAWNPSQGTSAVIAADRSGMGASYKGLAMANDGSKNFLYASNFHTGQVDVFDKNFGYVGSFTDSKVARKGFAPFGIETIGDTLFVTFAKQDSAKADEVAGRGLGFVEVFSPSGHLISRVVSRGVLNAPWGLAKAPSNFGRFSNDLLVGNFGDGRINAFKLVRKGKADHYVFQGQLRTRPGKPISIDGLWAIRFATNISTPNALYFTAGTADEAHGLLGSITLK